MIGHMPGLMGGSASRFRRGPRTVGCAAWLVAALLSVVPCAAQSLEGVLIDRDSGEGIEGVFVMAVDSAGTATAGALTDPAGAFDIALPRPGTYTLSAQRIGYRTTASPPLRVDPGQVLRHRMEVATEAIELVGLSVDAERRCTLVEGAGVALSRIWDEARKAMLVAEWTRESGAVEMQIEDVQRTLEVGTLEVVAETRTPRQYFGARPYESLPPEQLAAEGYIAERDDGVYYYAPDESVLLSESFLDRHCFSPRRDPNKPGLIGLAFEPVRQSMNPDIRGAFWLDQRTAELRFVEYRYSRLMEQASAPEAGGRVEFRRMEDGNWIVSSWFIRMPQLGSLRDHRGVTSLRVLNYVEEGGDVINTISAAESRARTRGIVYGRVVTRDGGDPLAGAVVFLSGTQYRTATDRDGRFRLDDVRPGIYPLVYRHERLEEAGTFARPVDVELAAGESVEVTLYFPPEGGPR